VETAFATERINTGSGGRPDFTSRTRTILPCTQRSASGAARLRGLKQFTLCSPNTPSTGRWQQFHQQAVAIKIWRRRSRRDLQPAARSNDEGINGCRDRRSRGGGTDSGGRHDIQPFQSLRPDASDPQMVCAGLADTGVSTDDLPSRSRYSMGRRGARGRHHSLLPCTRTTVRRRRAIRIDQNLAPGCA